MNSGGYRVLDANCDMADWIRLNFDAISTDIVTKLVSDNNFELLNRIDISPPAGDAFENVEDYEEALVEWESDSQLHGFPASHLTMWRAEGHRNLVAGLISSGFVVYEPEDELEILGPVLFGIDGGGYSFMADHWIPLRAHLARACLASGPEFFMDDYVRVIAYLSTLLDREGGNSSLFLESFRLK